MSGTNNAGKVESLSLDRFRFVQIMIYLHMFPFSYDLNLTIHCKGSRVHARHLANARGARGTESQKAKTFRIARFLSQKLSG